MVVVVVVVVVVAAVARLRWLWRLFNVPGADEPAPDASYDLHMFDDDYAYDHSDDSYSCHDDDYDSSYSCFNFYTTSSSCNYSYSCFNFYTATTASAAAGIPARVALAAAAGVEGQVVLGGNLAVLRDDGRRGGGAVDEGLGGGRH